MALFPLLDLRLSFLFFQSDLAEVVSVTPAAPVQAPGKKTDDKSFFDVSIRQTSSKTNVQ